MHTSAAGEGGSGQPAGRPVPKSARAWGLGTGRMRPCTRVQASGAKWLALAAIACCVTGASSFASGAAAAFARAAVRLGHCPCGGPALAPARRPQPDLVVPGASDAAQGGRRGRARGLSALCMSKKDKRYKLAKRGMNEDETVLAVAEQFRRREGQAQISWYPGHIAKAEQRLMEVLSAVDVVVEVRDARIPTSTTHPSVDDWLRNRNIQRVVCMSKVDMAPRSAMSMWKAYLESLEVPVAFMNCKEGGRGLEDLQKIIKRAGKKLNDRRAEREMLPRNIRVAVMGYPNVGKSALINRLAGAVKVKSENRAGVTKALQWVRVDGFDLLDSPGIIPAKLLTQEIAVHLAICDDIGQVPSPRPL